ncbi:DUF2778 domain-containing protein [Labrys monachus]|uniref:Tlde1 domain-containing protein n=1 Tax=Labrys monachus TaxID=217067 RepID=A0ABU0F800_9HYPH|nr:DUF2778 domain-containing protein [Labrys monachus]MDQ0390744.1 hypothetical protein [Labrys monachus]
MTYTTTLSSNTASFDSRTLRRGKSRLVVFAAVLLGSGTVASGLVVAATAIGSLAASSLGSVPDIRTQDLSAQKALALAARRRMQESVAELGREIAAEKPPAPQNLAASDARSAPTPALAAASVVAANDEPTPAILAPVEIHAQVATLPDPAPAAATAPAATAAAIVPAAAPAPALPIPLPPRREVVASADSLPLPPVHAAVLTDTGSRHGSTRSFSRGGDERAKAEAAMASIGAPPRDDRGLIPRLFDALKPPTESVLAYAQPDDAPAPPAKPNWAPSLGNRTAYYDIAAHTVYLPNGERLEAHSGLGSSFDNPRLVTQKNRGATPPNVYELSLRRQLFHGVQALRLTPVGNGSMYGRDGILAHSYMLGPQGASNGCVSFKHYPRFLQAYLNGEVSHLVVVPHMTGG